MSAREVLMQVAMEHERDNALISRGPDDLGGNCRCGFKRTSIVGEGTYRAHFADVALAALTGAGYTVARLHEMGTFAYSGGPREPFYRVLPDPPSTSHPREGEAE